MRIGAASECESDTRSYVSNPVGACLRFSEVSSSSPVDQAVGHARSYTPAPRSVEVYSVGGFGIDTRVTREVYVEREVYVMGGFSLFGRRRGL